MFSAALFMVACADDIPGGEKNEALGVTTPEVSVVKANSAIASATASGSHLISRGFVYSTSPNPTLDNFKVTANKPQMQVVLPWLDKNTTYYVRAYVQTSTQLKYSAETSFTTANSDIDDTDDGVQTVGPEALQRVSVHDPSIVWDHSSNTYYVFGSHRAAAKSSNLMTWSAFTAPWQTTISNNADNSNAFTTPELTKLTKGGMEYELSFNAHAWSARGSEDYDIDGNMWAPDVIYNTSLGKWCMYLSINGDHWFSSIILLTADNIQGPYRYQAPVVISGFTSSNYQDTDAPIVLGGEGLPARYTTSDSYGNHWPNAIDPCVFYDEDGKLWMSYGSWSGGIFMLELDEQTGLRDYNVTYSISNTSDPYFGKKISGGYYSSGEASYIEYIGGYYYLFVTNGGLEAKGGYQMRVFRSLNPDGPYVDSKGSSALLSQRYMNYGPGENDGNRGVNILGAYGEWGYQTVGAWSERSQGHNSVLAAYDGRAYLVYHSRFQNQGEGHAVRVHQLWQNEDGWLVAAPFEYTGEVLKTASVAKRQDVPTADIPGQYKLLIHTYGLDHENKALATPVNISLNADGTISGDRSGSWSIKAGTSFVNITLTPNVYKGVMAVQTMETPTPLRSLADYQQTPSFTALDSSTGVTIWGYKIEN